MKSANRLDKFVWGALGVAALIAVSAGVRIYRDAQVNNEIDFACIGAAFVGNTELTCPMLRGFARSLATSPDISRLQAARIVNGLARIPGLSATAMRRLIAMMPRFIAVTGDSPDRALEQIRAIFSPNVTATQAAMMIGAIIDERHSPP